MTNATAETVMPGVYDWEALGVLDEPQQPAALGQYAHSPLPDEGQYGAENSGVIRNSLAVTRQAVAFIPTTSRPKSDEALSLPQAENQEMVTPLKARRSFLGRLAVSAAVVGIAAKETFERAEKRANAYFNNPDQGTRRKRAALGALAVVTVASLSYLEFHGGSGNLSHHHLQPRQVPSTPKTTTLPKVSAPQAPKFTDKAQYVSLMPGDNPWLETGRELHRLGIDKPTPTQFMKEWRHIIALNGGKAFMQRARDLQVGFMLRMR